MLQPGTTDSDFSNEITFTDEQNEKILKDIGPQELDVYRKKLSSEEEEPVVVTFKVPTTS